MLAVLGPESKDLISSGDAVQDKKAVDAFVAAYGEMHRFRKMPDGAQILLVGDNFPFRFRRRKTTEGSVLRHRGGGMRFGAPRWPERTGRSSVWLWPMPGPSTFPSLAVAAMKNLR
jgi:hypothetical protein